MNQNQITMTRGDDKTIAIVVADDWEAASARFLVDGLFTKTATVGADDGSGYSTVTFTVDPADTEGCPDQRHAYRYELEMTLAGDIATVQRGLFVVVPDITT